MRDVWQEIDSLRKEMQELQKQVARQLATTGVHPALKVGDIIEVGTDTESNRIYDVQERTVAALQEQVYKDVRLMPGDPGPPNTRQPVSIYVDDDGERFILPNPDRTIYIEDQGNGKGKHVELDKAGNATVPPHSKELPMVVIEPTSQFHDGSFPFDSGRVYSGLLRIDQDGTEFYLVDLQGFGPSDKNHDVDLDGTTFRVKTDYTGNFKSMETV